MLQDYLGRSLRFAAGRTHSLSKDAFGTLRTDAAEVLLLDFSALGLVCADTIKSLKRLHPKLTTVVVAAQADLGLWIRCSQAGADGFFILPGTLESFEGTLRDALNGWKPFPREIQKLLALRVAHFSPFAGPGDSLSPAEREVMTFMAMGYHDKAIATARGTSEGTTHSIKNSIYKKLGVHSGPQAVRAYYLAGRPSKLRRAPMIPSTSTPPE